MKNKTRKQPEKKDSQEFDNFWGEVIHQYTRQDAINDGFLVEVDAKTLKEVGIRLPVALTNSVWQRYVEIPEGLEFQNVTGRLWDILGAMKGAIHIKGPGNTLIFTVFVQNETDKIPEPVKLKAVCGPGDQAEAVLTIMLPEED